jgi:glycosyltransferase involved in cell wall biosynthesis
MVVLPSRYREGVPRVLLEAGAMGLPMIATDMPGCRDVVRHGRNGLLVPPGDTAALMGAVLELVTAGEERIRMGARARDHVRRHFGLESVAEAYGAIYDDLMDGQPAAAAP